MYLDDRQLCRGERVEDGDRGVSIGAGIQDDAVGILPRLLDPVDELSLMVRLAEIDAEPERLAAFDAGLLDFGQGLVAIDGGLAQPQHVEVGSVENENGVFGGHATLISMGGGGGQAPPAAPSYLGPTPPF